jgi:hypothetical protein
MRVPRFKVVLEGETDELPTFGEGVDRPTPQKPPSVVVAMGGREEARTRERARLNVRA